MREHIKLCRKLVEAKGKELPIIAFTFGPLGILSMLRGQEKMFMDLVLEPDAVKYAVAAITETLMDYYDALMDTGVHAVMIDTLFASQSIMSKSMWLEFEGEYVRKLADRVHQRGCMMMIHNCGHGIYFDVQIETMQPEAISFLHLPDDVSTPAEPRRSTAGRLPLSVILALHGSSVQVKMKSGKPARNKLINTKMAADTSWLPAVSIQPMLTSGMPK